MADVLPVSDFGWHFSTSQARSSLRSIPAGAQIHFDIYIRGPLFACITQDTESWSEEYRISKKKKTS